MIIVFIIVLILVMIFWKIKSEYAFYNAQPPKPAPKPAPKRCAKSCPKNFKPVYDNAGKQYANSCKFEIAKCKNSKLQLSGAKPAPPGGKSTTKKNMAPSEQCDPRCGMIRKPVHDTDGKQYGNSCGFAYQKCKNPKLEMYDCAKHNCSNKSTPVCDAKGNKYSNVCDFLKATCGNIGLSLAPCSDAPTCEDIYPSDPNQSICKPIPDCTPSNMDKLLPEYCEPYSDDKNSQACVYVNNGKACRTVISPQKYNNEETKIKVSQIIKNAQPPELDIQIYPYTNNK